MGLVVNKEKCVGCRTCELACSFYHVGEFCPENSNIRIFFTDDGDIEIDISSNCNFSNKDAEPPCVEFCPTQALKYLDA